MKVSQNEEAIHKKIEELSVPLLASISTDEIERFQPYYVRYYENKFHTNRLILISIAEGHDVFRQNKVIEKINFCVEGVNMLDINTSGKKKAGAKKLKKQSVLCYIKCQGEEKEYPVYACVPASLIEVNQLILDNPQLLTASYKELGYIGVLYPKRLGPNASAIDKMVSNLSLLSEEEYKSYVNKRGTGM